MVRYFHELYSYPYQKIGIKMKTGAYKETDYNSWTETYELFGCDASMDCKDVDSIRRKKGTGTVQQTLCVV